MSKFQTLGDLPAYRVSRAKNDARGAKELSHGGKRFPRAGCVLRAKSRKEHARETKGKGLSHNLRVLKSSLRIVCSILRQSRASTGRKMRTSCECRLKASLVIRRTS